jgi:hypothetical protein
MTKKQRKKLTKTFAIIAIGSMVLASVAQAISMLQSF